MPCPPYWPQVVPHVRHVAPVVRPADLHGALEVADLGVLAQPVAVVACVVRARQRPCEPNRAHTLGALGDARDVRLARRRTVVPRAVPGRPEDDPVALLPSHAPLYLDGSCAGGRLGSQPAPARLGLSKDTGRPLRQQLAALEAAPPLCAALGRRRAVGVLEVERDVAGGARLCPYEQVAGRRHAHEGRRDVHVRADLQGALDDDAFEHWVSVVPTSASACPVPSTQRGPETRRAAPRRAGGGACEPRWAWRRDRAEDPHLVQRVAPPRVGNLWPRGAGRGWSQSAASGQRHWGALYWHWPGSGKDTGGTLVGPSGRAPSTRRKRRATTFSGSATSSMRPSPRRRLASARST